MIDGAGLVYEKTGNTGAAAYGQGAPIGINLIGGVQQSLEQEKNIRLQDKLYRDRTAEAKKEKDYNLDIDLNKVWDTDQQYLGGLAQSAKQELAALRAAGVRPDDYLDDRAKKYGEVLGGVDAAKNASIQQKERWGGYVKELRDDQGSADPKYDYEASAKNLTEYRALKPLERINYDESKLLVRKPKVFSTYEPVKDLDVNKLFVGKKGYEDEKIKSSKTKLDEPKLKATVELIANDPANNAHYEWGKSQPVPLWNNKAEYAQALFDKKKLEWTEDSEFERKPPKTKGMTIIDIDKGSGDDLVAKLGTGTQYPTVYNKSGVHVPTLAKNSVTLGNINATVSGNTAFDASNGEPLDYNGKTIQSGTMSTPLVFPDNRFVPIPFDKSNPNAKTEYKFYNPATKTTETFTGTYDEIAKQMIKKGFASYKPMVEGTGKDGDETFTVWVPAESIVEGTQQKDKPLEGAEQAYYVLKKWSDEKNGAAGSSSYTIKGKKYTLEQLKALGYNAEQVASYLDK